ncbi:MAG: tRNA preQ1(34) S-adenosylmethionine ribosyltransferase-isomerase QueA [Leptospiraceae bacterium]|nr:tRNA preQ1(34) S-adenosylmethionine ribosyltransferase-isomerase QueA [Leptospiraceae bacterium]
MKGLSEIQREYSFDLPDELIARHPAQFRDHSRLMLIQPESAPGVELQHRQFFELDQLLEPDDILVWNDTLVEPRRILLNRKSGARIEALFLEPAEPSGSQTLDKYPTVPGKESSAEFTADSTERRDPIPHAAERMGQEGKTWNCLIRNAARIKQNEVLIEPVSGMGFRFFRQTQNQDQQAFFLSPVTNLDMHSFFLKHGQMPIPPYLGREEQESDRNRYQTVFSGSPTLTSAAAPTAGLHFTAELIQRLESRGVRIASVRLAVGLGTFAPLSEENLKRKQLHAERFSMPAGTAELLNNPGGRIIAVGTTTLRALESNIRDHGSFIPGDFETRAFFHPPDRIQSIQGLITNFHLPGSSLLMLVAAFAGRDRILQAYLRAIENRYRFYSYGDAMLVFA